MATKKRTSKKTATTARTKTAGVDPEAVRAELVDRLRAAANPAKAKAMQAYMKTTMAFWGVANPAVRTICREVFSHHPVKTKEDWLAVAQHLWRTAKRREEWFAAIEWTGLRVARPWQEPDVLPLYEEMIVSSAWWDTVDVLAVHLLGRGNEQSEFGIHGFFPFLMIAIGHRHRCRLGHRHRARAGQER